MVKHYSQHGKKNHLLAYKSAAIALLLCTSSVIIMYVPPSPTTISFFITVITAAIYLLFSLFLNRTVSIIISVTVTTILTVNTVVGFSLLNTSLLILLATLGIYIKQSR